MQVSASMFYLQQLERLLHAKDNLITWGLRVAFLFINNLYIWRLMNMNCYIPKGSILFPVKYSLLSLICNIGLLLASLEFGRKFPKLTLVALLPTFVITPFFVAMDYWIATWIAVSAGGLGIYRCLRRQI